MALNRTIYLIKSIENVDEYKKTHVENFYLHFNVSDNLTEFVGLTWPKNKDYITYICPRCNANLIAEWMVPELTFDYKHRGNDTIKKIKECFDDYIELSYSNVTAAGRLNACPLCNGKLVKNVPYAHHNVDTSRYPKAMATALKWTSNFKTDKFYTSWSKSNDRKNGITLSEYTSNKLQPEINEELRIASYQKADKYISARSSTAEKGASASTAAKIDKSKINTDVLKEYLSHLINIESNILGFSERLRQLYTAKAENNRDIDFATQFLVYEETNEIEERIKELDLYCKKTTYQVEQEKREYVEYTKCPAPSFPDRPVLAKSNIFNRKKVEAQNAQLMAEYERAMAEYEIRLAESKEENKRRRLLAKKEKDKRLAECTQQVKKREEEIAELQNKIADIKTNANPICPVVQLNKQELIDSEITQLHNMLKSAFSCREKLYNCNIIFPKYRNLITITKFYEYLNAGRCYALEGADGAYNIYENEIRLDNIITQLEDIKTTLDEIKDQQTLIYKTLKNISSSLQNLEWSMDMALMSLESIDTRLAIADCHLESISKHSAIAAYNSQTAAFYSKVNAELTGTLLFMEAMR